MKNLRPEIKFKGCGGITDAFDDVFKSAYNITDDEYDYISGEATDEEINIILDAMDGAKASFSIRRKALEIRNKYLKIKSL